MYIKESARRWAVYC